MFRAEAPSSSSGTCHVTTNDWDPFSTPRTLTGCPCGASSAVATKTSGTVIGEVPTALTATMRTWYRVAGERVCSSVHVDAPEHVCTEDSDQDSVDVKSHACSCCSRRMPSSLLHRSPNIQCSIALPNCGLVSFQTLCLSTNFNHVMCMHYLFFSQFLHFVSGPNVSFDSWH